MYVHDAILTLVFLRTVRTKVFSISAKSTIFLRFGWFRHWRRSRNPVEWISRKRLFTNPLTRLGNNDFIWACTLIEALFVLANHWLVTFVHIFVTFVNVKTSIFGAAEWYTPSKSLPAVGLADIVLSGGFI